MYRYVKINAKKYNLGGEYKFMIYNVISRYENKIQKLVFLMYLKTQI